MNRHRFFAVLFILVFIARLCHVRVLWDEEGYPLAAAAELLHGKVVYRDFWFDKPPLVPLLHLAWGAQTGWPLRLAGAVYVVLCCWLLFRFARDLWGEREAKLAAALLAFFLTLWMPHAVMPLGPDLLLIGPHIAAVYLAWRGRPFWSGVCAGVGLLINVKAVFVILACALWQWRSAPLLLAGFATPGIAAGTWMAAVSALVPYWDQVWRWGVTYAADSVFENPLAEGVRRTAGWVWFHLAIVVGAFSYWISKRTPEHRRFALWVLISIAAIASGLRFFPRYYFHLLPVAVLAGSRGLAMLAPRRMATLLLLLLIPVGRFGPVYVLLALGQETKLPDLVLSLDSREAAKRVAGKPGDTLLVWGYRPDVFAYTHLPAGTPFLDSQPLTGVIADRHLVSSSPAAPELAAQNRARLLNYSPTFIVDGLGPINGDLAISRQPDLRDWLSRYKQTGNTDYSVIYRIQK